MMDTRSRNKGAARENERKRMNRVLSHPPQRPSAHIYFPCCPIITSLIWPALQMKGRCRPGPSIRYVLDGVVGIDSERHWPGLNYTLANTFSFGRSAVPYTCPDRLWIRDKDSCTSAPGRMCGAAGDARVGKWVKRRAAPEGGWGCASCDEA